MTLDTRIAAALRDACSANDVEQLVSEVRQAAYAADTAIADARADALSPLASTDAVAKARKSLDEATFRRDRLEVAVSALVERVQHLLERERQEVEAAERDAAITERNELAEAIRADMPAMVRRWTELVRLIAVSDARLAAAGVTQNAESLARDYPANGYWSNDAGPVMRLRDAKLPLFATHGMAWGDTPSGPVWPGEA